MPLNPTHHEHRNKRKRIDSTLASPIEISTPARVVRASPKRIAVPPKVTIEECFSTMGHLRTSIMYTTNQLVLNTVDRSTDMKSTDTE